MILSNIVTLLSFAFAIYLFIITERWKRRFKIEINKIIASSHSFYGLMMKSNAPDLLKERFSNLNHEITATLLSIDKKTARKWILNTQPMKSWPDWEQNLQVSMWFYRLVRSIKKFFTRRLWRSALKG